MTIKQIHIHTSLHPVEWNRDDWPTGD